MEISKFTIFHGNFMIPWRESDYAIFRGIAESRNAKVFNYCYIMVLLPDYCYIMVLLPDYCYIMVLSPDYCYIMVLSPDYCYIMVLSPDYFSSKAIVCMKKL